MGRFLRRWLAAVRRPAVGRSGRRGTCPEVTCLEGRRLLTLVPTAIVVQAVPNILAPPDGQFVPVTVSGSFKETAPHAAPTGFFYVTDQYGDLAPRADIALTRSAADPTLFDFSFTVDLQAKRGSMTYNGRQYDIMVGARDAAGAVDKTIAVNVPKNPALRYFPTTGGSNG